MLRSKTGLQSTITRKQGVTITFSQPPPPELYAHVPLPASALCSVKFAFSGAVEYDTGLHFHADKGEALRVESGAILVQLGAETVRVTRETGEVTIPRYTVHRWWLPADAKGETVVWERTLPGSREKEAFFRTLVSYIGDLPAGPPSFFQLYAIFSRWDNYPVLGTWCTLGPGARLVVAWTHTLGALGRMLGYQPTYAEYLPREIHDIAGYVT
ncbi:hypothetical protein HWV62_37994 [Athelia sp. TMB]|nr:hypothetical protein HWV62_37994 [Athelia sp. TMB]